MKKVFALLFVAGVMALTSCGKKEEATEATTTVDSAAVETAPAEPVAADSAASDSTATAAADTTKK